MNTKSIFSFNNHQAVITSKSISVGSHTSTIEWWEKAGESEFKGDLKWDEVKKWRPVMLLISAKLYTGCPT